MEKPTPSQFVVSLDDHISTARWEGEESAVVFDPKSGETLLLNLVEQTAFDCLVSLGPEVGFDDWVSEVAHQLEVPVDREFESYLLKLVEQLEHIGLLRSLN